MKTKNLLLAAVVTFGTLAAPLMGSAADTKPKAKPYTLKNCVVSGDKLGEMGDPYTFEHEGREIKLCCKNCLKDFNKNPKKYVKEIEKAEKDGKKAQK